MGVLIHQSTEELPQMMSEVVRCSSRWVLCGEYFSEQDVEVPYRGHHGALFKRDYGSPVRRGATPSCGWPTRASSRPPRARGTT